jgi:hypothetical protein
MVRKLQLFFFICKLTFYYEGNLALSRAIGDFEFKQNEALSPKEQVVTCKLIHCLVDKEKRD